MQPSESENPADRPVFSLHRGRKKRDCEGRDANDSLPSTAPSVGTVSRLARVNQLTGEEILLAREREKKKRKERKETEITFARRLLTCGQRH